MKDPCNCPKDRGDKTPPTRGSENSPTSRKNQPSAENKKKDQVQS